ncbi:MAG TPA: GDP-mannose 4,6-dehydratase [Burkholderiales bacterium]|nr:GDP-mannose 4,6-dehydratase [Burkholderiales bacterium]
MRKALICGVTGQDGAYLSRLLLDKGYEVHGASRDAQASTFANLAALGVRDRVRVGSVSVTDFRSVMQAIERVQPDEIYNLAGQSSVGLSFEQPVETFESISVGTLNILEAVRFVRRPIRIYSAGSSECFGNSDVPADELTPFRPRSPYAIAKAAAYWQVANYRESYGLFACTGILFNHESPLRPARFVTRKITAAAARIARGSGEKLKLGNMDIQRDWGWAPDYVEAMWGMLQQAAPADFVIATGETRSLRDFVDMAFREASLNAADHVESDPTLFRPADLEVGRANPARAQAVLGWKARHGLEDVVRLMMAAELKGGA